MTARSELPNGIVPARDPLLDGTDAIQRFVEALGRHLLRRRGTSHALAHALDQLRQEQPLERVPALEHA